MMPRTCNHRMMRGPGDFWVQTDLLGVCMLHMSLLLHCQAATECPASANEGMLAQPAFS